MSDPRYPIGPFTASDSYTTEDVKANISRIEALPPKVEAAVRGLSAQQLDTPYRDGGWTVRQVVHHLADSHMNAYIRTKWTLTEATPTIKAYDEKLWAETPETRADPAISVQLLASLHVKWTLLLKALASPDYSKEFFHPDSKKHQRIDRVIALYAWHGEHHLAHITELKRAKGWK
jgi:hypothetical protein